MKLLSKSMKLNLRFVAFFLIVAGAFIITMVIAAGKEAILKNPVSGWSWFGLIVILIVIGFGTYQINKKNDF